MALRKATAGVSVAACAAAEAAAAGRLGFIVVGSILGLPVLLTCLLAVVAVFGTPDRQVRAERILRLILRRESGDLGGASVSEPPSGAGPAPTPDQRALAGADDGAKADLVPITRASEGAGRIRRADGRRLPSGTTARAIE